MYCKCYLRIEGQWTALCVVQRSLHIPAALAFYSPIGCLKVIPHHAVSLLLVVWAVREISRSFALITQRFKDIVIGFREQMDL